MNIKLHSSLQIRIWKGDNRNNGTSHWFVAVDWLIFFIYLKKNENLKKQTFNVAGYWLDDLFPKYFDLLVRINKYVKTSVFLYILE